MLRGSTLLIASNVKTNVGKKFLGLIKKYFIKGGKIDETGFNLSKILNVHTVKLSYSTTSNISRHLVKHNHKVLNQETRPAQETCTCRKYPCPLDGDWNWAVSVPSRRNRTK